MTFCCPRWSFETPAAHDAYGNSDLVANDVDAADVIPLKFDVSRVNGAGQVKAVNVFTDREVVTNANFILHLYREAPSPSVGDNGAFAVASVRQHVDSVACDMTSGANVTSTDKSKRFALTVPIGFQVGDGQILYGLLATVAAYDRAGVELFEVTLEIEG
jgi:hypothetical protein